MMERIHYSDEFICPKCGVHTALLCKTDGTYQAHCFICNQYYDVEFAPMTNADRIRSMSDEELAEWIGLAQCPREECMLADDCVACWLSWLKSPVEVDNG